MDRGVVGVNSDYRFNFTVNVIDGAFFGLALGTASFVVVLPLFVDTITDSATLIGLIPAIHVVGWQLPQLFTSSRVTRLARFKPMVMFMTSFERIPFFGLVGVALWLPSLERDLALILTFSLLIWQGMGGGLTATAWQSMIAKIIPSERHGIFFGIQAAAANLFASIGGVLAGVVLERYRQPFNFAWTFLIAGVAMTISWIMLGLTRERASPPTGLVNQKDAFRRIIAGILLKDSNFRWFVLARIFSQLGSMAFGFYTIYAVRHLGMTVLVGGLMAGVFSAVQIIANPILGWIGDRFGHRVAMELGVLSALLSALLAMWAPNVGWFYVVFILAGVANVALWTIVIAMTLEFGTVRERPTYIGLSNTLVAPSSFLAPLIGGWLADSFGFQFTFLGSALGGVLALGIFHWLVRDPNLSSTVPTNLFSGHEDIGRGDHTD